MRSTRPDEGIDVRERLRQVDEHVAWRDQQRAQQLGHVVRLVPAPRRVPVFLRCHPEEGGFAELTITHPVVASRRGVPTG